MPYTVRVVQTNNNVVLKSATYPSRAEAVKHLSQAGMTSIVRDRTLRMYTVNVSGDARR